jgi:7,8-dihydro-6-hydroxymethylpterin dimethyltransferase
MPHLKERDYTYFTTVRGMCRKCREVVPARVFFRENRVWQQSLCGKCGNGREALIASDQDWYLRNVLSSFADHSPLATARPSGKGCPRDCGPCAWHATQCQLPVFSITNACQLQCPICFTYNRRDEVFFMSAEEAGAISDWIVESSGDVDVLDITGGEPTLHPQLLDVLRACQRRQIGRIVMNSNGIRLAEDMGLCRALADLGICVALSFNTIRPHESVQLNGTDLVETKLRAIENLTEAGARITLLNVMVRGINEDATEAMLDLMCSHDSILSMCIQTMTYTGQGGGAFEPARHIPVDEATQIVCKHSRGQLKFADFLPRASAHPLCYSVCYMLKTGSTILPFTQFTTREEFLSLMKNSYLIRLDDQPRFFQDAINAAYAKADDHALSVFRQLVTTLYPSESPRPDVFQRQRLAEASVRTIYIYTHMDEDTFDCSRAVLCPDQVPDASRTMIPACTYNLFYRMQDPRFYAQ